MTARLTAISAASIEGLDSASMFVNDVEAEATGINTWLAGNYTIELTGSDKKNLVIAKAN